MCCASDPMLLHPGGKGEGDRHGREGKGGRPHLQARGVREICPGHSGEGGASRAPAGGAPTRRREQRT